jgi:hypothetical protein
VTQLSLVDIFHENWGNSFFRNIGTSLPNYTVAHSWILTATITFTSHLTRFNLRSWKSVDKYIRIWPLSSPVVPLTHLSWYSFTERVASGSNFGFGSLLGQRLSWRKCLVDFVGPSKEIPGQYRKIISRSLPSTSLIVHYSLLSIIRSCYSKLLTASLRKLQIIKDTDKSFRT